MSPPYSAQLPRPDPQVERVQVLDRVAHTYTQPGKKRAWQVVGNSAGPLVLVHGSQRQRRKKAERGQRREPREGQTEDEVRETMSS